MKAFSRFSFTSVTFVKFTNASFGVHFEVAIMQNHSGLPAEE